MAWMSFAQQGAEDVGYMVRSLFDVGMGELFGDEGKPAVRVASPGLAVSPALQAAQFETLLQMGIFDPASLVRASPMSRMIATVMAAPARANDTKGEISEAIRKIYRQWEKNGGEITIQDFVRLGVDYTRVVEPILEAGGYFDINEFFQAEQQYQTQMMPLFERAQQVAMGNFESRLGTQQQLNELMANLPDASAQGIANLTAMEKDRYMRQLGDIKQSMIAEANMGNYNPGAGLERLTDLHADADLEAMSRALAVIGAQQGVATNQLNMLQGSLTPAQQQANQLASISMGTGGGSVYTGPGPVPWTPTQSVGGGGGSMDFGNPAMDNAVLANIQGQNAQLNAPAINASLTDLFSQPGMF